MARHFLKKAYFVKNPSLPLKKHQFHKFDIIGIWCDLYIKFWAWVDLRFGISYKLVANTVNFWQIFLHEDWIWSAGPKKRSFCQFLVVNWKKMWNFFFKISTLRMSAYPSSPFRYQLQVDRQPSSGVMPNCFHIWDFAHWKWHFMLILG